MERTVAWLAGCRHLHRRYERKAEHFSEPIVGSMQEVREGVVSQSVDGQSNET
jgi:hypothetical protein